MLVDLNEMFQLRRLPSRCLKIEREELPNHLTLGEMVEMIEEVAAGLLPGLHQEGVIELTDIQWWLMRKILRRGILKPWEDANLFPTAGILEELGFLDLQPLPSDNLHGGAGCVRCLPTPRGTAALLEIRPEC